MNWLRVLFAGLVAALACLPARAQQVPATVPAPPTVSLITFEPGDLAWERFGHNALLLRSAAGTEVLYNYGVFDFNQRNFFLNFARGRMVYRLQAEWWSDALAFYGSEGRGIYEQRLALTPAQRSAMQRLLSENLRPENVEYRYDYFLSNCSTRVRDAIDEVLGGVLKRQLEAGARTSATFRSEVVRLMWPAPVMALGMDFGLGPQVDEPLSRWDRAFVPQSLADSLREVSVPGEDGRPVPLIEAEGWLLPQGREAAPQTQPSMLWPFAAIAAGLALLLIGLQRLRSRAWARRGLAVFGIAFFAITGVLGCVMLAGWLLTEHWGMWGNQNLLLANPLSLIVAAGWIGAFKPDWRPGPWTFRIGRIVCLMALTAILVHYLPRAPEQANTAWIALLVPIHAALFASAWRQRPRRASGKLRA